MKKMYSFIIFTILTSQIMFSQNIMDGIVKKHFDNVTAKSDLTTDDVLDWKITDVVPSLNPAIQHVYVQQYHLGIPIQYATYKLTIKDKQTVTWKINQFITDVKSRITSSKSALSPENAILKVVSAHNLPSPQLVRSKSKTDGALVYDNSGISLQPIEAKQVYIKEGEDLKLTWRVSIYQEDGQHWWNANVDAVSGKILHTEDWVISCNFGDSHESHEHESRLFKDVTKMPEATTAALAPDSYNVYPVPIESPNHGNRSIVTNPANLTASPFGWHDTNGSSGAEFTITRGNNVWAQDDSNGNNGTGFSPDGGSGLDFDFPIDFNQQPSVWRSAAITNLFFWNNIMHDVFYQYGFDEASGNFQENNYGNGGVGSDSVNADAQDGSGTNNANFSTPPDGGNPRMQMFLFTNPTRDGDLDNVIIAHEYGHGISIRLVGGPSSNNLGGSEQMGEGWSDWFGLMLTMKAGDVGTTGRGVGTYAIGQPTTGGGIRPTAYSTNRSINNTDYADIGGLARPHGVGYAFATILWDMTWGLIDAEGFDDNFYTGTGGNNIAMALVIEGLKNTANNPGFVSGRDGVLQADQDLYGGQYECIIWKAFADRGVGQDADENNNGGSNGQSDQTVSFVNPCDGGGPGPGTDECTGDISSFPYAESFEGTVGAWSQVTSGDDLNWTVNSGGTPSNGTGPGAAAAGTSYIYVEASGNGSGYPSKRAILNSPCLDLSGVSEASLSFQYHMVGSAIGTFTVEARTDNTGDWDNIFSRTGAQGSDWNAADIDLASYVGNASVQLRLNVVTGNSWQGDIAIDDLMIEEGGSGPGPDPCEALNFNDFTITPFANQDAAGIFSIVSGGAGLSLVDNTWKYISLAYNVTANTVIEFDFSSTAEGEIHAVGFEDDNGLTPTRYFKVYGTQNYGITNYDNYSSGTTTYVIPVGDFYTGSMDKLLFINDNDTGSGNTSIFSNVKIYEGSCGGSRVAASFGANTPIIGDEGEGVLSSISMAPNPTKDSFVINVLTQNKKDAANISATIYTVLGRKHSVIRLHAGENNISAKNLALSSGIYLVSIESEGEKIIQKLVIQ